MTTTIDLRSICLQVCDIADDTSKFLRREFSLLKKSDVREKSANSLVSYVDEGAEKLIVEQLKKIFPESGFITEEDTIENSTRDITWIVDPLDGTTNYVFGIPHYSISIALMIEGKLALGVVYDAPKKECFYAYKGGGAYMNHKRIGISNRMHLKDCLVATGFHCNEYDNLESLFEVLKYLIINSKGIRRIGSAALDLAYVAAGRIDAYYESKLSPWDVAAGIILVEEAQGIVSDFSGGDNYLFGKEIIAANEAISRRLLNQIKKHFYPQN